MSAIAVDFGPDGPLVCDGAFVTVALSLREDGTPLQLPRAWTIEPRHRKGDPAPKVWRVRQIAVTLEEV